MRRVLFNVGGILFVVVVWEFLGRTVGGPNTLPPFTDVIAQIWKDRQIYPYDVMTTSISALEGFLIGNAVAVFLAILFLLLPVTETLLRASGLILFSAPLIVLTPILGVALGGHGASVALAAVALFYPTLDRTLEEMHSSRRELVNIVEVFGGTRWTVFRIVRLRFGLPGLATGLKVAGPVALLGAMLGESTGSSHGLGRLLYSSLGGTHMRVWGICIISATLSGLSYFAFAILESHFKVNLPGAKRTDEAPQRSRTFPTVMVAVLKAVAGLVIALCLWYVTCAANLYVFKTPLQVLKFATRLSPEEIGQFRHALFQTAWPASAGFVAGLAVAFLAASCISLFRPALSVLMPLVLIPQTVPLVALTALICVVFGRGAAAITTITVSVTFFPSFEAILYGLQNTDQQLVDLVRIYSDSRLTQFWRLRIPNAVPYFFQAVKLSFPRVLLGVILAEYLVTHTGLGGLLYDFRGKQDFLGLWLIAALASAISVTFYLLARFGESALRRRAETVLYDFRSSGILKQRGLRGAPTHA
jgi:ABC-type nitrate/sulfonate/bicarbonate transport system permease component